MIRLLRSTVVQLAESADHPAVLVIGGQSGGTPNVPYEAVERRGRCALRYSRDALSR